MKIQITDDYVMTADAHNFILNAVEYGKAGKTAGKQRLRAVGYFQTVPALCEGLMRHKMRQSTKRTLQAFLHEHQQLCDEIRRVFKAPISGIGTMPCNECGGKQK